MFNTASVLFCSFTVHASVYKSCGKELIPFTYLFGILSALLRQIKSTVFFDNMAGFCEFLYCSAYRRLANP